MDLTVPGRRRAGGDGVKEDVEGIGDVVASLDSAVLVSGCCKTEEPKATVIPGYLILSLSAARLLTH